MPVAEAAIVSAVVATVGDLVTGWGTAAGREKMIDKHKKAKAKRAQIKAVKDEGLIGVYLGVPADAFAPTRRVKAGVKAVGMTAAEIAHIAKRRVDDVVDVGSAARIAYHMARQVSPSDETD